jgi:FkbM family methyltransferase
VLLRHRTRDVDLVNEILGHLHSYEPPPELAGDLAGPLRILDLGANIGMFGAFALGRWTIEEMRAFEPDPSNAAILNQTIAANGARRIWSAIPAAIANRSGRMLFLAGRLAESRQAIGNEHGVSVEAIDVFSLDHDVDLCKIDIEASEWAILADPRLAEFGAKVLVIEWHSLLSPEPDPRRAVHRLLREAGYHVVGHERVALDGSTGLVWARRDAAGRPLA